MKRLFLLTGVLFSLLASGQNDVDDLFRKYSDEDGFVSITIEGNFLKILREIDDEKDEKFWPSGITGIRILARKDNKVTSKTDFYDVALKALNKNKYEELMRIKGDGNDMIVIAKMNGRNISELLVAASGDDHLLIQLKGNMTQAEARRFSSGLKRNGCSFVADID